jgi:hypothetical protein
MLSHNCADNNIVFEPNLLQKKLICKMQKNKKSDPAVLNEKFL